MPPSRFRVTQSRVSSGITLGIRVLDCLIVSFLLIWVAGGIPWQDHVYLRHGADPRRAAIVLALLGYFLIPPFRRNSFVLKGAFQIGKWLKLPSFRWGVLLCFCGLAIAISILQCLSLRVTLYDVGIFHQILWSLSHGFSFHSTISGAGNYLSDHFSPSLAILAPFFLISKGSPFFLPVAQSVLIFFGASAWVFLASRVPGVAKETRESLAAAAVVFILTFDSLWRNIGWGFHENLPGFVSLSWAFALIFSADEQVTQSLMGRLRTAAVFVLLILAACSKEILLLDVALIFCCWAYNEFKKGQKFPSLFLLIVAVSLSLGFVQYEQMSHPPDKNYFDRYYAYLGKNLNGFLYTLLRSPSLILKSVGGPELLKYVWAVFSPWLFIPLLFVVDWKKRFSFTKSGIWLIAILPSFASAALATYYALRRIEFHYVLELWPILASLTILWLAKKRSTSLIWAWALLSFLRMDYDPIGSLREFWASSRQTRNVRAAFQEIPSEASVVADELTGTWLAGRTWMTRWPDTSLLPNECPDYVVVRYSEKGTLVERGVGSLIARCKSSSHPAKNSDLVAPIPVWRYAEWSAYRLGPLRRR